MEDALCSREPQASVYNRTRTEKLKKRASATKLFFMFSLFLIKNTKKLKLLKKDNYYKFLSDGCFNVLRRTPSSSFVLVSYS